MRKKRSPTRRFRNIFDNPKSKSFVLANDLLACVTLVSILALVLETVEALESYRSAFEIIEYVAVGIFSIEYMVRLLAAKKKLSYALSFFGIIDLLAIIPTYLGLANLTFLKAARALRIIRFLRIMRLTKLMRISKKKRGDASSLYTFNLQIYGLALLTALLILGTLLYIFEESNVQAKDIPSAMYWAFKVILGGIPYSQPETPGGTAILIAIRFTSMILLGLMLNLVGTMMRKMLIGSEKDA